MVYSEAPLDYLPTEQDVLLIVFIFIVIQKHSNTYNKQLVWLGATKVHRNE